MKPWSAWIRVGRCASLGAILAGCAGRSIAPPPDVPPSLRAPADQVPSLALRGAGVQVYECQSTQDKVARFTWVLRGPEADLTDHSGKTVGRHFAGPTWEADDGSTVTGEIVAQENSPNPDAIAWLLLRATSNAGKGLFAKTRSIQRLHTVGGKAPAGGCDSTQLRKHVRVAYSADYYFYSARK